MANHPAVDRRIHDAAEALEAVGGLLADVVAAGRVAPAFATRQCAGAALRLALNAYASDPVWCHPLLDVVVAALASLGSIETRSLNPELSSELGTIARAAMDAALDAYERAGLRHDDAARASMFKLTQAAVRVGCASLTDLAERVASLAHDPAAEAPASRRCFVDVRRGRPVRGGDAEPVEARAEGRGGSRRCRDGQVGPRDGSAGE